MWCAHCQADVAAEVLPGEAGRNRVRCANCGAEITRAAAAGTTTKTDEARALLRRWADEKLLDPFAPPPAAMDAGAGGISLESPQISPPAQPAGGSPWDSGKPAEPASPGPQGVPDRSRSSGQPAASASGFRIDSPHSPPGQHASAEPARQPEGDGHRPQGEKRRVDASHVERVPAPHFEVQAAIEEDRSRRSNWSAVCGQILAYLGVAGLTVGTALVLWGYFGGPKSYTPTGWLVATAGQMLLFLGVVTLVSGGMEQTADEVARQMDRLGDRLIRIEAASRDRFLQGPHTPPRQPETHGPSTSQRRQAEAVNSNTA